MLLNPSAHPRGKVGRVVEGLKRLTVPALAGLWQLIAFGNLLLPTWNMAGLNI